MATVRFCKKETRKKEGPSSELMCIIPRYNRDLGTIVSNEGAQTVWWSRGSEYWGWGSRVEEPGFILLVAIGELMSVQVRCQKGLCSSFNKGLYDSLY